MTIPHGILFDLDGVVYEGKNLIHGANTTLKKLQDVDIPYRFITNTSRMTKNNLIKSLEKMGLDVSPDSVFTAPQAAIEYCKIKGYRKMVLIVPDPEMKRDFSFFKLVDDNSDVIVLGDMGRLFTFELLNKLFKEIINGSCLVAMHKNRYWQSSQGITMDLGGFVVALEHASDQPAVVMGKPNKNIFRLAVQSWNIPFDSICMVGDDIEGDIGGAQNAGMKSVLVKTGKFRDESLVGLKLKPDFIINSIADLPDLFKLN